MTEGHIEITDKRFQAQSPDKEFHAPVEFSGNALLMEVIRNKYDPSFIREMMDLRDRDEARTAKKAYIAAMAEFKADPPEIIKSKKAFFDHRDGQGRTEYSYADISIVARACNEGLSKYGLSASWETSQENDNITVTCIMTHHLGHSEKTSLTAKADQSGKKNPIQAIASTISYLQKYTLLAITGLAAQGMDDDGQSGGNGEPEYITEDQQKQITELVGKAYGKKSKPFFDWLAKTMKVESITVETIPAKKFKFVCTALKYAMKKREPGQEG